MQLSLFLPLIVSSAGLFLLLKLRFFFLLHPIRVTKSFVKELRSGASASAFWLALAGTLGVGNIFGTAAGIMTGGAGSVFWLILSALFSGMLKYSETSLTLAMKEKNECGFQSILPKIFARNGKFLAVVYSVLCLCLAFLMGSAIQSSAVSDILDSALHIPVEISAILLSCLIYIGVHKGAGGIERATARLVPIASVGFISLCLFAIIKNAGNFLPAVRLVFSEALTPAAFSGGVFGFLCSKALTEGFARGILSNEAGIGTSAMAHSRADNRTPYVGGLFGIAEVIFDTVILCGLTALALLCSSADPAGFSTPMAYVFSAFNTSLGMLAGPILICSVFIFGYSTMICWYYYGSSCMGYIFGKKTNAFTPAFLVSAVCGALLGAGKLLAMTDTVIFLMALITLSAVVKSHKRIYSLTPILSEKKSRRK